MTNRVYQIIMNTMMGKKYGLLDLRIKGRELSGSIHILGNENKIKGSIQSDGRCCFSGELITPMRCMKFLADGCIKDEKVDILIHSEPYHFSVSGERKTSEL